MKNKNKVVKTDPLDKLIEFSKLDMIKFQSVIYGYDLKKARKFQDKLKDLCFKYGLIDDSKMFIVNSSFNIELDYIYYKDFNR